MYSTSRYKLSLKKTKGETCFTICWGGDVMSLAKHRICFMQSPYCKYHICQDMLSRAKGDMEKRGHRQLRRYLIRPLRQRAEELSWTIGVVLRGRRLCQQECYDRRSGLSSRFVIFIHIPVRGWLAECQSSNSCVRESRHRVSTILNVAVWFLLSNDSTKWNSGKRARQGCAFQMRSPSSTQLLMTEKTAYGTAL